jgi:hypothetical protein
MLIPRFTIKILLILTAVAAVLALVLREAAVGHQAWAIAVCTLLGSLAAVFLLFILFWSLAWIWDQTFGQAFRNQPPQGGNPFASAGPPRQLVPPRETQG